MQKSKLLLEPKQETNSEEIERENKIYNISETELEANLLQNIRFWEDENLETVNKI